MKHDRKCEAERRVLQIAGWTPCGCADRAIAAARHQGRLEGAKRAYGVAFMIPDPDANSAVQQNQDNWLADRAARTVAEMEAEP